MAAAIAAVTRLREKPCPGRLGGPPKPWPHSPAIMSKQGLFPRCDALNQTPVAVNAGLPATIFAAEKPAAATLYRPSQSNTCDRAGAIARADTPQGAS